MAAGSIRRRKASVRDIDILATSRKPEKLIEAFTNLPQVKKILGKGKTKAIVILKSGVQADIRVLNPKSWGAGLLYFTGNKNYNIAMRKIAIRKGYKLSEYGLFDKKTNKMIAGKTENDVTKKLGIKLPNPEDREM
jgi:DNA polymerase (family 10)